MTSLHPVLVPLLDGSGESRSVKLVLCICVGQSWIVVLVIKNSFPPSGKQDGAQVRHTPMLARWSAHFICNVLSSN